MTTGAVKRPTKRGCGRGVFALLTWEPLRRPGQVSEKKSQSQQQTSQGKNAPTPPNRDFEDQVISLISKHSYTANTNSPGGFKEMSLKVGEIVEFLETNKSNPFWWNARRETGETGYIPATYMKLLSEVPTSLPWLQKEQKPVVEESPVPVQNSKPYVYQSAYDKSSNGGATQDVQAAPKQYYCDVCDRNFNGPKPYSAHMVSKAHKEEVEVQNDLRS